MSNLSIFSPLERYTPSEASYRLLPFRFMRWTKGEVLLVNEVGEHIFVESDCFRDLATHRLPAHHPMYSDLKTRHFLLDGGSNVPIDLLATKYRTKKSFLDGFTRLHMFVVTLRCDHTCAYCQVSRVTEDKNRYDMTRETALEAITFLFRSPSPVLKVEFQGGESLLNFDVIRFIVEEVERRNGVEQRHIEFVIATILSQLTDEVLEFCDEHSICLSTSLDGPAHL